MSQLKILSSIEQVAGHLRKELMCGERIGFMPGVLRLEDELRVNRKTVEGALRILEKEGLLESQGPGRRRRIVLPENRIETRPLRVAIMDMHSTDFSDLITIRLRSRMEHAGFKAFFSDKSLLELGMDPKRVARYVTQSEADAWVVRGASREVLQWFSTGAAPALALFGNRAGLPIAGAGPDTAPAFSILTHRLIDLGHQRITLLIRKIHREPRPSLSVSAFLDGLEARGVGSSSYNLPDWEETADGFEAVLESLFHHTPPTALIIDEAFLYIAAYHFLADRGLRVPQDVSLICTEANPDFSWCKPSIAHISWDSRPVVNRVLRWANNVARGRDDHHQSFTKAEFIEGGTVGAAATGR